MKHIMLSQGWSFGTDPFPAFRSSMSYGHNQNDREFIGVNGAVPSADGVLPENIFKVVKTKEDAILIVAGEDTTPRCLLFVGSTGGFRGDVSIFDEATTGKVLKVCSAGNACDSGIEVAAILDISQSVAFHKTGRNENQVDVYTWNGVAIESKTWSKRAWDRRNDPPRSEENVTWIPGNFQILQVSGDRVSEGVTLECGRLHREVWGSNGRLAYGLGVPVEGNVELTTVRFGRDMHEELVIAPIKEGESASPDRCVVLVHEYSPGSGAKRYPSFYIDWQNAGPVEKIESVSRGKGSGSDTYTLIFAPIGWAENIAGQFVDQRDYHMPAIAYKPGAKKFGGKEDLPESLILAFSGNRGRIEEFMRKVAALSKDQLDEHTICVCGRGRVQSHLLEVSGDPDFFCGADPNAVKGYVADVHFRDAEVVTSETLADGGSDAMTEAMRKAGLV
ncbi:MAG: hypothetical protein Q7S84_01635 [bacterium]|nr:hypothetical protein [bacterium]